MRGLTLVKKTKILIPKRRPELLRRQRLIDFIHRHTDRRLFLVSAPAGYGKTALLVDYASDTELPVCWYTLDSSAQEPRVFIEHFIACIRQRFPHFGDRTVDMIDSVGDFAAEGLNAVLISLVNEILDEIAEYFVIVLDDFHLVEQSLPVATFVTGFLDSAPDNCCLVVAGRAVPACLPLVSLASKRQIAGLGSNDLRFTADETAALIKRMYDIELSPRETRALAEESEGWITGILLSTHALWQGFMKGMILARGTMTVYDYLASEVFAQQDASVQDFLLGSSILEELSPSLCDAILEINDSASMLSLLEERNLFLSRLEDEGRWYRYHRLFQGFLATKLRREQPVRFRSLHRQAADYFRGTGDPEQAVAHLLAAEEHEMAAAVMEGVAREAFMSGRHLLLSGWHQALAADVTSRHPWLALRFAKAYSELGHHELAMGLLATAERAFDVADEPAGFAETLVQKATVLRIAGNYAEAGQFASRAASLAVETDGLTAAEALRCWGIALGQMGRLNEAIERLKDALQRYEALRRPFNAAQVRTDLGAYLERTGALDEALAHFEKAVTIFQDYHNSAEVANVLNSEGVIYYYRGEYDRARKRLLQALDAAHQAGSGRWTGYVLAGLGDIERDSGHANEALDHYGKSLSVLDEKREGFLAVYIRSAQAELYAAQGQSLVARDLGRQALELARSHGSAYEEALARTALGLAAMGAEPDRAVEELGRAGDLFQQSGALRDYTRVCFMLAAALDREGAREAAFARLEEALALGDRIEYRHALRALRAWALPLLREAAGRGVAVGDLLAEPEPMQATPQPPAVSCPETPTIRLQGFGVGCVQIDGQAALTRWGKVRELLFLLATVNQGRGLRAEEIYEALWPGLSQAKAYSNFHSLVYRTRRALPGESISFDDVRYRLAPESGFSYDVTEFLTLVSNAQVADDPELTVACYERAVALYQGDFLTDVYADWSHEVRRTLREQYVFALSKVAEFEWQRGNVQRAIATGRRWLREEPADEAVHRLLMRCFAEQGDISAVRRQFHQCQETLHSELGAAPSKETTELYHALTGTS